MASGTETNVLSISVVADARIVSTLPVARSTRATASGARAQPPTSTACVGVDVTLSAGSRSVATDVRLPVVTSIGTSRQRPLCVQAATICDASANAQVDVPS